MNNCKKVSAFTPLIATIILGSCMAITIVNYVAPTYEIKAGEIKDLNSNQEDNNVIATGNFDLADEAFFNWAKGVIDKIISSQSLDVNVVSGATYSSNGIISAVKNALTGESDNNTVVKTNASSKSITLDEVEDAKAYRMEHLENLWLST